MPPVKQNEKKGEDPRRALILGGLLVVGVIYLLFAGGGDAPPEQAAPAAAPATQESTAPANPSPSAAAAAPQAALPLANGKPGAVPPLAEATRTAVQEKISKESHQCVAKVPDYASPSIRQDQRNQFCICIADLAVAADPRGAVAREEWIGACHTKVFHEKNSSKFIRELVPEHVTDDELAAIPAEKLQLYKEYCRKVAGDKAKQYNVDAEVFIKLNENYIRSCIKMQAAPPALINQ